MKENGLGLDEMLEIDFNSCDDNVLITYALLITGENSYIEGYEAGFRELNSQLKPNTSLVINPNTEEMKNRYEILSSRIYSQLKKRGLIVR